jgi:hypothetical protein
MLGIRTAAWARRIMPDPRNPRIGPTRRHPFAVEPGTGGEDAKFRPVPEPRSRDSAKPETAELFVDVENSHHLTWASQQAKAYLPFLILFPSLVTSTSATGSFLASAEDRAAIRRGGRDRHEAQGSASAAVGRRRDEMRRKAQRQTGRKRWSVLAAIQDRRLAATVVRRPRTMVPLPRIAARWREAHAPS